MRLSHLHLNRRIPYSHALALQDCLLNRQFKYKSALRVANTQPQPQSKSEPDSALRLKAAPNPVLLTFETLPTYTVGRRHLTHNPLRESQIAFLTGRSDTVVQHQHNGEQSEGDDSRKTEAPAATFFPSPRGGLLTYHAPGQLTGFLILDLRVHGLTPRCYVRFLDGVVAKTCAEWGVANTLTTEDPGVWISECDGTGGVRATSRKVCAIGVHVSRGVTSHGIGLNVLDQPFEDQNKDHSGEAEEVGVKAATEKGYLSWGFGRIVACGLEGKSVTWLQRETNCTSLVKELSVARVATTLAQKTADGLGLAEDVEKIAEAEVLEG